MYNINTHSVLAWRIPETGKPGGLPSMGSHRVGHDWSDLAAAYIYICCIVIVCVPSLTVTLRTLSGPMIPATAVYELSACVLPSPERGWDLWMLLANRIWSRQYSQDSLIPIYWFSNYSVDTDIPYLIAVTHQNGGEQVAGIFTWHRILNFEWLQMTSHR